MNDEIDELLNAVGALSRVADPAIAKLTLTCAVRVLTSGLDPLEVLKQAINDRTVKERVKEDEPDYSQFVD